MLVKVRLRVDGRRALFARPEFRRDVISYDVLTPHAAQALLRNIYSHREVTWVIDSIRSLNPPRFERIEEQGCRMLVLCDVSYIIEAHFDLLGDHSPEVPEKHASMFDHRVRAGAKVHLGRPIFPGEVTLLSPATEVPVEPEVAGRADYGWLLHSIAFASDGRPRYFRAEAVDGIIQVPAPDSLLLFA